MIKQGSRLTRSLIATVLLTVTIGCANLPIEGFSVKKEDGTQFTINKDSVVFINGGNEYHCIPQADNKEVMVCTFKDGEGNEVSLNLDATKVRSMINGEEPSGN